MAKVKPKRTAKDLIWFGVKTVYAGHYLKEGKRTSTFEERVVIFRAENFDQAIAKAEAEAEEYCKGIENTRYVGYLMAYATCDEEIGEGAEVYSLIRESELSDDAYLERFHTDGNELAQMLPPERTDKTGPNSFLRPS